MLIRYLSKLRSKSKGGLNCNGNNYNYNSHTRINHVGRKIIGITPILSIFALLGNCLLVSGSAQAAVKCPSRDESWPGEGYVKIDDCFAIPVQPAPEIITAPAKINSASLIIDGGMVHDKAQAIYGTNYVSHTISVSARDIADYALTLSGDAQLTGPNNTKNNWSYAWDDTSKADNAMTYAAMGDNISLSGTAINNDFEVSFSKKLAFSTTFADNATAGTYSGQATLSLILTPRMVTSVYVPWDKMIYMQDMSPEACASVSVGTSKSLYDYRSAIINGMTAEDGGISVTAGMVHTYGDKYTIQKLSDGNCWMTQNMKLDLSTIDLTPEFSDVTTDYPKGTAMLANSTWTDNNSTAEFTTNGKGNSSYNAAYGYYYSWCAATAGTCSSVTTRNTEASGSICPKGWKLPKARANSWADNDFLQLMKATSYNGWDGSTIVTTSAFPTSDFTNKYVATSQLAVSGTPNSLYLGGANWPRAGYVYSGGLYYLGSYAYYWSRTADSDTSAYYLVFYGSNSRLYPASNYYRHFGYSVRCVAYSS